MVAPTVVISAKHRCWKPGSWSACCTSSQAAFSPSDPTIATVGHPRSSAMRRSHAVLSWSTATLWSMRRLVRGRCRRLDRCHRTGAPARYVLADRARRAAAVRGAGHHPSTIGLPPRRSRVGQRAEPTRSATPTDHSCGNRFLRPARTTTHSARAQRRQARTRTGDRVHWRCAGSAHASRPPRGPQFVTSGLRARSAPEECGRSLAGAALLSGSTRVVA